MADSMLLVDVIIHKRKVGEDDNILAEQGSILDHLGGGKLRPYAGINSVFGLKILTK